MQYLGGKFIIAKQIAEVLRSYRDKDQTYLEPFVGAAWVLIEMTGNREASDINPYLIAMYQALQEGWIPPDYVTEEMYQWARSSNTCPLYLKGFIGFGCSWGGKWFGGYARDNSGRNYALNATRSLVRILPRLVGVSFSSVDYTALYPSNKLIYCDPPYESTTSYGYCGKFDFLRFWDTMRLWSSNSSKSSNTPNNTVIISGYNCPDDFSIIAEIPTETHIRGKSGKRLVRVERLFKYKDHLS